MIVFEVFLILIASVYAFLVLKCCVKFYFYKPEKNLKTSFKKVSVMVSAKNEEENILKTVLSIKKYKKFLIDYVVINDGSTDKTERILKENNFNYINLPFNLDIFV